MQPTPLIQTYEHIAAVYRRVSTDRQDGSLLTQEERIADYARFKRLDIAGRQFSDADTSGGIPIWEREGGGALLKLLQTGIAKHLIVAKLDRLGRSAIDLLSAVQFLDTLGVTLHVVDLGGDSLSTQGAAGRLMLTVLAGMAEYERELIRGRIRDRLDHKFQKGELIGTVPFGFDAVETGRLTAKGVHVRRLVDNPGEQYWIRQMARWRSTGWSFNRIAKALNQIGVPAKCPRGLPVRRNGQVVGLTSGLWQSGNVAKLLQSKHTRRLLDRAEAAA
jgi:DNA invertase Pin-like site-specific DNA recombinase